MESVQDCSMHLRQIAMNAGMVIDDIYRNVNGISFQMASMESAYQGHTIMKPATRLFTEIVLLYRNDAARYQQLLKEAKGMACTNTDNEAVFMAWLAQNVSGPQLSELYLAFQEIEQYAKKVKTVRSSLYEKLDSASIKKIKVSIESSKIFKFTHKRQWGRIISALNYLLQFANQNVADVESREVPMSTVSETVEQPETSSTMERNEEGPPKDTISLDAEESSQAVLPEDTATRKQDNRWDKEVFYRWLQDDQHMSESTCRSYVSAIRSAERFAEEHNLASCKLYTSDAEVAKATADELFADVEFIKHNNDQHNRFRAAISKLLAYYGSNWSSAKVQAPGTTERRPLKATEFLIDVAPYKTILEEYFPKGYRLESALDMKRMRRYYEEVYGKTLELDQAQLESAIRQCGLVYDGRLYIPQKMLSDEMRNQILSFIRKCFDEGRSAVYYEAVFREFSEELLDHNIFNADMLKAYLTYYVTDHYYIGRSYLAKEYQADIDPIDEVRQCLKQYNSPLQVDELCDSLSHIPEDRIRFILSSNSEFVRNSKGEYFHADSLDLTEEELENIANIIYSAIEAHEFISGNELYNAIQNKYPYTFEKNAVFSVIGWRDALKYKYAERFAFVGNIISRGGTSLSMSDVFAEYGKGRQRFSLDELEQFADSIGTTIYFDSLYTNAIRISHKWFVSKANARFSVLETDVVLDRICDGNYMAISDVTEFAVFPDASYPWTEYLLEQYAAFFSEKFYLMHGNYNKNCAVGAIVRKTCHFDSFDELVTDILAHSDIPLRKEEVLDYLAENGYIARRSYTNIEALMITARAMRNQKEK